MAEQALTTYSFKDKLEMTISHGYTNFSTFPYKMFKSFG